MVIELHPGRPSGPATPRPSAPARCSTTSRCWRSCWSRHGKPAERETGTRAWRNALDRSEALALAFRERVTVGADAGAGSGGRSPKCVTRRPDQAATVGDPTVATMLVLRA